MSSAKTSNDLPSCLLCKEMMDSREVNEEVVVVVDVVAWNVLQFVSSMSVATRLPRTRTHRSATASDSNQHQPRLAASQRKGPILIRNEQFLILITFDTYCCQQYPPWSLSTKTKLLRPYGPFGDTTWESYDTRWQRHPN